MKIKNKILDILAAQPEKSLSPEQLAKLIGIHKKDYRIFYATLTQMKNENLIYQTKNGAYAQVKESETYRGQLRTHKKGFGFISVEDESEDLFVRMQDIGGALDGDVVRFEKIKDPMYPDRQAAKIVAIEMRANLRQVGTIVPGNKKYFGVTLDDGNFKGDVFVLKKSNPPVVIGHKVVVVPEEYPKQGVVIARVVEVLGHANTPGIDILSIVKQYDIPTEFPLAVTDEVEHVPTDVRAADLRGRVDLRDKLTITIDGADAKDLDDAISLEKLPHGNYLLSVHIADVSHYVQRERAIDAEALKRGTSVYLADRVIPMLPVELSNGICSLHPNVERLTLTAEMEIDRHGRIVKKRMMPTVIYSDERLSYDEVNQMLKARDEQLIKKYKRVYPMLQQLERLAKILARRRYEQGALDFAINEAKIIVDKAGKAIDIQVRQQDVAEKIIEQCMVVANEAVATYFFDEKLPFIYRTHGIPQDVKLDSFRQVASNMGVNINKIKNTANVKPKALQQLLTTIQAKSDYDLLSTLLLRTMQKAEYSTDNIGHFGLAMQNYTHFTSPIRRYPDLIVHRLLRHYLFKGEGEQLANEQVLTELKTIAHETSIAERRAIECERAVTNMKMAEYMESHVGEVYSGVINGVISSGFFVSLDNLVEGKVGMESLKDDYYVFLPEQLMLLGRRTKKTYRMGDKVKVRVERANKELSEIQFSVIPQKLMGDKRNWKVRDETSNDKRKKKRPRFRKPKRKSD
jgi:ribonuclease R